MHKLGAQTCKFGIADRSILLQSVELRDFIGGTETNYASKFIARLLSLLHIAFRNAPSLKNQICKHAKVGNHYPGYYPDRLDPA